MPERLVQVRRNVVISHCIRTTLIAAPPLRFRALWSRSRTADLPGTKSPS